jgi:hypothetical protein
MYVYKYACLHFVGKNEVTEKMKTRKIHCKHKKTNIYTKISFISRNLYCVPYGTICISRVLRNRGGAHILEEQNTSIFRKNYSGCFILFVVYLTMLLQ